MAELTFREITKRFGSVIAVDDVSLDIASGEFVTLVGASGCGKTTLLRIIAGFTRPDEGELSIDGKQVENLPPSKREVGFVFQSYALFPTHTVAQNIGFSLSIRRRSRSEIDERVRELCELTRLSGLEARYPHELSGGQQQRVALARALAPNPAILLLDEPLSALDAKIRGHLRVEIRRVVDRLGITAVYVTHDQEEALSISDRVAVMSDGAIQQVGRPMEVYLTPATRVVADFIGTTNHLVGRLARNGMLEAEGHLVAGAVPVGSEGRGRCVVCVRPEHLELFPDDHADGASGTIVFHSFLGQSVRANVETGSGVVLVVDVPTTDWLDRGLSIGDRVVWRIRPGRALIYPADEEDGQPPKPVGSGS